MQRQNGFSLVEVLVALLLLAVGALGFVAMTISSSKLTGIAFERVQATALAEDLIERININYPGVATPYYVSTYTSAPTTYDTACESTSNCARQGQDMAAYDLAQVEYEANQLLPQGLVEVLLPATANNHVQVLVSWGGTTPTVGTGPNDCVSLASTVYSYNSGANCIVLESTVQ